MSLRDVSIAGCSIPVKVDPSYVHTELLGAMGGIGFFSSETTLSLTTSWTLGTMISVLTESVSEMPLALSASTQ